MPKETITTRAERLVDDFIRRTGGECDPVRYRQAMIDFWEEAIQAAVSEALEENDYYHRLAGAV